MFWAFFWTWVFRAVIVLQLCQNQYSGIITEVLWLSSFSRKMYLSFSVQLGIVSCKFSIISFFLIIFFSLAKKCPNRNIKFSRNKWFCCVDKVPFWWNFSSLHHFLKKTKTNKNSLYKEMSEKLLLWSHLLAYSFVYYNI